jgi:sigma-B regulation protein RsbU (phosphoserine phosphatase)
VNQLSEKEIDRLINQRKFAGLSEVEKEKISAELEAARQIQKEMIPKELPDCNQISVSAYSTLSVDVCGDFYDFYKIDDNTYGFLIGDASGKGFPAAMLISQIYAIIKSDISYKRSIKQTLSLLNTYLKKYSAAKNFATLFYGIYNLKSNKLQFANAGHNYPLIVKNDGKIETLKTTGPALGILNNIDYKIGETRIDEGNFLFLFTDGLPEAMNNEGIQFGEERILHYCAKNYKKHTSEFINGIKNKLFSFKSKQNETDDITFMVVKRNEAK